MNKAQQGYSKYTTEQMVQILKIYQESGNMKKTAADAGISRTTLRKWVESLGPQVFNHNAVQDIVYKVDEQIVDRKTTIANRVMDAKELFLERIIKQIPRTKDMDQLTRGLKILNELDKEVGKIDPRGDGGDTNTINYIKIVTDQLILNKNELKIN